MKTSLRNLKENRGMALLLTVILLAFAAFYYATYLWLVSNEHNTVVRSQQWNASLPVAEAGVEEALALINKNAYATTVLSNWSQTATHDGWANIANITVGSNTFQVFSMSRTLPNNSGSYTVYVTNEVSGGSAVGGPFILSTGTANNESGPSVSRSVLVQTSAVSISGMGGLIAQDGLSANGNVEFDSWDSSNPLHSFWQSNYVYRANYYSPGTQYGIWSNTLSYVSNSYPSRTAEVTLFTDSNAVDLVGNITVAGYIETGADASDSVGANCTVGDLPWCFGASGSGSGSTGVEPGHSESDANMNFHSYALPIPTNSWQSTWLAVPTPANVIKIGGMWTQIAGVWTNLGGTFYTNNGGYTIGGVSYSMVITNRLQNTNWVYYSIGPALSQNIFIDAQYVVLYLTNGLSYSGQDYFTVNTNADVQVWSTGNVSATGKAVINNMGDYAHAFSLYDVAGTPITVDLGGNGAATGYYYLPSSSLTFGGGGASGDFVGSIICYSISDGGHVNFHFDQSFGTGTPDQYIATSWAEVTTQ